MLRNSGMLRRESKFKNTGMANPMQNLANLVDVMLVLACGLMVAIITLWDLDLMKITDILTKEELVEVEDLDEAVKDGALSEDLNTKGYVYEDEETGKMYVIKK